MPVLETSKQIQLSIDYTQRSTGNLANDYRSQRDINYGWIILCVDEPVLYLIDTFDADSVAAIVNALNVAAGKSVRFRRR